MSERSVCFVVPTRCAASVIADFGGGLGFEPLDEYLLPPLDLLQLAACARASGWACTVLDGLATGWDERDLVEAVRATDATVAVVSSTVPTLSFDVALARELRPHVDRVLLRFRSTDEGQLLAALQDEAVDACMVDECESNLDDVLAGRDRAGTAWLEDGRVVHRPGPGTEALDALPVPARDLVSPEPYSFPKLGRATTLLASRGCPYPCGYYCPYPLVQGRRWRSRSAGSVADELQDLAAAGTAAVLFRDPVFTFDRKRIHALCEEITSRGIRVRWWCETRADRLDRSLIGAMASAGCVGINVGVESGDPDLRFSTLKRGVTDDQLAEVCAVAAENSVAIAFLMMVGFPGETRHGVLRSAELVVRCRPAHVGIGFPVDHPGTRFRADALEQGWVVEGAREAASGGRPVVVSTLAADDMVEAKDRLERLHDALMENPDQDTELLLEPLRAWAGRF